MSALDPGKGPDTVHFVIRIAVIKSTRMVGCDARSRSEYEIIWGMLFDYRGWVFYNISYITDVLAALTFLRL